MVVQGLLNFLFPDPLQCFLCGTSIPAKGICPACAKLLHQAEQRLKLLSIPHVREVYALAPYTQHIRKRLHALKYWDKTVFARNFAQAVIDRGIITERYDFVTAVPMHRRRYIQRGYNQAELLAEEIATARQLPFRLVLKRVRHTKPQHMLGRTARAENVADAFMLTGDVRGQRVLLVDDILTTGSTLSYAASQLAKAGVKQVDALVVAVSLSGSAGQYSI